LTQGSNNQARLREGIDAAKRGDKLTARRLLQQVLAFEKDNELALMWMASVVDSIEERRSFLQRVLQVNPNNERAREALRRLGGNEWAPLPGSASSSAAASSSSSSRNSLGGGGERDSGGGRRGQLSPYTLLAGLVALIVVVLVSVVALNPARNTPTSPTPSNVELTFAVLMASPSVTATDDNRSPTATLLPGIIATFDPSKVTQLPPTFTWTFTPTTTPTLFPSTTPIPLQAFNILYTSFEPDVDAPSLYRSNADGTGERKLASGALGGFSDIALAPDGNSVAFVRGTAVYEDAAPDGSRRILPQLYIGTLDDLSNALPVTTFAGIRLMRPSWSPDGESIIIVTDQDGDEDIYRYSVEGGFSTALTDNNNRDFDASYSPDGETIVFASDFESPGFTEIYRMKADGTEITRLTDESGNSYEPVYSPDGTRIAYIGDRESDSDLFVMDANGSGSYLLTVDDNDAEDQSPQWSPDGRWIVFASNRESVEFSWFAIDLSGRIEPLRPTERINQSLTFIAESR